MYMHTNVHKKIWQIRAQAHVVLVWQRSGVSSSWVPDVSSFNHPAGFCRAYVHQKNKYVPIGSEAALCALQQQSLNTSVLWHVSSHFIYPISLCSNSADRIPCRNDFALAFVICFLRSMPCGFGSTRKWRSAVNRQQLIPMNKQLLATNVTWEHAQTHVFLTPSGAIDFLVKWRKCLAKTNAFSVNTFRLLPSPEFWQRDVTTILEKTLMPSWHRVSGPGCCELLISTLNTQ